MTDAKAKPAKPVGKLYYTATSCGVASFMAAFLTGLKVETETVDLQTHKTASGADFYAINPKGNVPALVLADGTILNENVAVLQFIADQNLTAKLVPANGTHCRYKLMNILSWLNSELHPAIGGQFAPNTDDVKTFLRARATKTVGYLEKHLLGNKQQFLFDDHLTIADLYGHIVLGWTKYVGFDLKPFPHTQAYLQRISELADLVAIHKVVATKPTHINY